MIGQAVIVNGHPLTVVGVAPRGFYGLEMLTPAEVFVPLTMQPQMGPPWLKLEGRRFRWVQVFGRLADGTTIDTLRAGLDPLYANLLADEATDPAFNGASAETRRAFLAGRLTVLPAPQGPGILRESLDLPLRLLMAAAFGVLLIACANVANLLIARGVSRQRELALRVALGAGRARLAWLMLAEALLLAVAGSAVGLVLAGWGVSVLVAMFAPTDVAFPVQVTADGRILAFTIAVTALTVLGSGLVPALRSLPPSLAPALKAAGGGVVREQPRLRRTLVAVQVGLSFLLLAGSGLFLRSLDNLQRTPSGLAVDHVLSFQVSPDAGGYSAARSRQFVDALLLRAQSLPGVRAAGVATIGILEGGGWSPAVTVEGFMPKPGQAADTMANVVTPGFFDVLQVPVRLGRTFELRDRRTPVPNGEDWPYRHAVVNETFVRRYFGGRNPIGRHFGFGSNPGTPMPVEIVGVVADTRYMGVREEPLPQVFLPAFEADGIGEATFYVRTTAAPEASAAAIRREVAALDPGLAVFNVASLDERVARSLRNERLLAEPVDGVRRAGDAAGDDRPLRRDGLHGVATDTGDRDPDRPGRARLTGRDAHRPGGRGGRGHGPGDVGAAGVVARALRALAALWHRARRSVDARGGGDRPARGRGAGRGHPGPPRRPRRSDDGAARRVTGDGRHCAWSHSIARFTTCAGSVTSSSGAIE